MVLSRLFCLFEFLRINEYFPKKKALEKISFIKNVVFSDQQLMKVWDTLSDMFKEELKKYE